VSPREERKEALPPHGGEALALVPGVIPVAQPSPLAALVPEYLRWLQFVRERAENTVASYGFDLEVFIRFCDKVGLEHPTQVRPQMIDAYLAWLRHELRLSVSTRNRRRASLVGFFDYMLRQEIITKNPARLTDSLKKPERLPKRLTWREREHTLSALAEDDSPIGKRDLAVVALGCLAGLRAEEMVTLRMDELDLDNRTVRVIGKGDKQREVPVVDRLCEILQRYLAIRPSLLGVSVGELYRRTPTSPWRMTYPAPDGRRTRVNTHTYSRQRALRQLQEQTPKVPASPYVLVRAAPRRSHALKYGGKPMLTRSIFALVQRRVGPLVGRPVSPHALRHTFASVLIERGATGFTVQRAMGHKHLETTGIYVHLSDDTLRAELERHIG
jgi:site-specific recombinase XerD